jgi:hypothetical protein
MMRTKSQFKKHTSRINLSATVAKIKYMGMTASDDNFIQEEFCVD